MQHNKVCIILPYYGAFSPYFSIFLKSCAYNSEQVDYLFFSDLDAPKSKPKNVIFHALSFQELNVLISTKLELEINLKKPYKLCDFKPAYGDVFSEYIANYSHWGHGDEDLILGDLSSIIPEKIKDFDVFSLRQEWNSGPFCLFKNTEKINSLYKQSISYPAVFLQEEFQGFDECFQQWVEFRNSEQYIFADKRQSMTYIIKKMASEGRLQTHYQTLVKESIEKENYLIFDKGKISQKDGKEFLLYHFITEKKNFNFQFPAWDNVPDKFYIDDTGFYTEKQFFINRTWIRTQRRWLGFFKMMNYFKTRLKQKITLKFFPND